MTQITQLDSHEGCWLSEQDSRHHPGHWWKANEASWRRRSPCRGDVHLRSAHLNASGRRCTVGRRARNSSFHGVGHSTCWSLQGNQWMAQGELMTSDSRRCVRNRNPVQEKTSFWPCPFPAIGANSAATPRLTFLFPKPVAFLSFFSFFLAHVSSEAPFCSLRKICTGWEPGWLCLHSAAASMVLVFWALDPRCFAFRGGLELNLWKVEPETRRYRARKPPRVTTGGCPLVTGVLLGPQRPLHCPPLPGNDFERLSWGVFSSGFQSSVSFPLAPSPFTHSLSLSSSPKRLSLWLLIFVQVLYSIQSTYLLFQKTCIERLLCAKTF